MTEHNRRPSVKIARPDPEGAQFKRILEPKQIEQQAILSTTRSIKEKLNKSDYRVQTKTQKLWERQALLTSSTPEPEES